MNNRVAAFQQVQDMSTNGVPVASTDLESVVGTCYQMALVYLRKKIRSGVFDAARFGVSPEDVAMFVITSLFQKNQHGQCVAIATRFHNYLQEGSSDEYLHRVRQMTFSVVEEELSRYYAQHTSPQFDSFRDDLCAAADESPSISIEDESDCRWIVIHESTETLREFKDGMDAPVMPLEFMAIRLNDRISSRVSAAETLEQIRDVLSEYAMYRSAVPLPLLVKAVERIRSGRLVSPSPSSENQQ